MVSALDPALKRVIKQQLAARDEALEPIANFVRSSKPTPSHLCVSNGCVVCVGHLQLKLCIYSDSHIFIVLIIYFYHFW